MADRRLDVTIMGERLTLVTRPGLFSPEHVDRGTLAMLSVAGFAPGLQVMDLGCGYGVVGILAAKKCGAENVVMSDIDPEAVDTARANAAANGVDGVMIAVSDGFAQLDEAGFDLILSNPPYQTDFSVAKAFIEKGFNRLKIGGRMLMVTKRRDWYRNNLRAIFGGVRVHEIDGYYVFEAQKRQPSYANAARRRRGSA
ncbi:MAG: methyltransferase [Clostridia bacterium]|nr:methyltransferase [Clostridia bacterium]